MHVSTLSMPNDAVWRKDHSAIVYSTMCFPSFRYREYTCKSVGKLGEPVFSLVRPCKSTRKICFSVLDIQFHYKEAKFTTKHYRPQIAQSLYLWFQVSWSLQGHCFTFKHAVPGTVCRRVTWRYYFLARSRICCLDCRSQQKPLMRTFQWC